jgi:outer membrane biosynthesis protein TonB
MKVQVILDQDSITEAIRDYVAKNGIATPVQDVEFTVARKGGTSISAEVILGNEAVMPTGPVKRNAEPEASEPKTKKKATAPKEAPKPEPESEPEAKEEPEPAKTEPPFEPDVDTGSANDNTQEEPTKESRSLFG